MNMHPGPAWRRAHLRHWARLVRRDLATTAAPFARSIGGCLARCDLQATSRAVPGVCRWEVRSSVLHRVSGWCELALAWFLASGGWRGPSVPVLRCVSSSGRCGR
jgi:hypothetical protein